MIEETKIERQKRRARERARRWRERHPERAKAVKRAFIARHPDRVAQQRSQHHKAMRERRGDEVNARRRERRAAKVAAGIAPPKQRVDRAKVNAYRARRRARDPVFKLAHAIGGQMRRALKGAKDRRWTQYVDYTARDLVTHIEAQFEPWMNWKNYGHGWHIDHRRPIASFSLPDEVAECWALSNLRPLAAKENMRKRHSWPCEP